MVTPGGVGIIPASCAPRMHTMVETGFQLQSRSAVAINSKFSYIGKAGKVRMPLQYDFISYYNHGLSLVLYR